MRCLQNLRPSMDPLAAGWGSAGNDINSDMAVTTKTPARHAGPVGLRNIAEAGQHAKGDVRYKT
jgi:hypothetical protein